MTTWPGKWVSLWRPGRGSQIDCVLLGDPREIALHWTDGGNVPCWGVVCKYCPSPAKLRWYFPAMRVELRADGTAFPKSGIVELFDEQVAKLEGQVRGLKIRVQKSQKGKLFLAKTEPLAPTLLANLAPAFDTAPFLERIFGMPLQAPGAEQGQAPDVLPFKRKIS